jgi:peptide deformylase
MENNNELQENKDFTIQPIIVWPDNRLTSIAKDVTDEEFNTPELDRTIVDLTATMKYHKSVGIAASQVGIDKKIVVMEFYPNQYFIMINPVIVSQSDEKIKIEEGCISVPNLYEKRSRPNSCVVKYNEIDGTSTTKEFTGAFAFGVQHNIDLLYGKCFADDVNIVKKRYWKMLMAKYKEQHEEL